MRLALTCLIGLSVLAAPCVYDTDPREPSAVAAVIAKLFPMDSGSATGTSNFQPIHNVSGIFP